MKAQGNENQPIKYGEGKQRVKENYGRIGADLAHSLSYDRQPQLFDTKEMKERDKEILQVLKDIDAQYCIDRRHKPVYLTPMQYRIITALSYYITQPEELEKDDVKAKIANPYKAGIHVSRVIPIEFFTQLIFGDTKTRNKKLILREIYKLARVRQYIKLADKWVSAPLINLGIEVESEEIADDTLDAIEIIFGTKFFVRVTEHFSPVYKRLFNEWRKKGRGTELYSVLLTELLFVYPKYIKTLKAIRTRVKSDKRNKKLSTGEIEELIQKEINDARALDFPLTTDALKKKIGRDYESNRANKLAFWKDLAPAIEGVKATGLIERTAPPASTHPRKIVFTFSQSYNESPDEATLLEEKIPT